MAYVTVAWAYKELVSSAKLQQMCDNDTYLKQRIDNLEGAWTTVTPSLQNITVGSGTNVGRVLKVGRTVKYAGIWQFGAGAAVGSNPLLNLPYAASTAWLSDQILGSCSLFDSGTTYQAGWMRLATGTTAQFHAMTGTGLTATAPWTWTTNDKIAWEIEYEAAS